MSKIILILTCSIMLSLPFSARAQEATCEEAKAMAERAAAFLIKKGPKAAFDAFNDLDGPFFDRSLYIFAFDKDGIYMVHAVKPHMEGRSVLPLTDVYGSPFGKDIMAVQDTGWVYYKYPDPINKDKIRDKRSYVIRVGEYRLGSGCYSN